MAAIDDLSEDGSQIELEDGNGREFGALAQLERAATNFDRIAYNHDLIEWGEIRIGQGKTRIVLPWDDLGFSPDAIEALKKADATQTAITLFDGVKKAGNELKGMRSRIQTLRMTRYGNKWVSTSDQYGLVCLELAAMLDREAELRRDIHASYADARRGFLVAIADILSATSSVREGEILHALQTEYACKFPARDRVDRDFGIRIEKPRIRPALKRMLEGQVESAEMLARIEQANRTVEEEQAIARINRMNEQIAMEAKAQAVDYFDRKVLEKIAGVLNMLRRDGVKPGSLTKAMQSSVTNALEDLSAMTSTPWAESMQEAVEQVRRVQSLAQDDTLSGDDLRQEIDVLLEEFSREYRFAPIQQGHRSVILPDIDLDE